MAKRLLLAGGLYHFRLRRRRFPGVAVLCYHGLRPEGRGAPAMTFANLHVTGGELAGQLRLLAGLCQLLTLEAFRRLQEGEEPLPARPVLLTFDDGYRSVLTAAAPLLARFRAPAAVFVTTGPVLRGELLWFDALAREQGEAAAEEAKALPHGEWKRLSEAHRQPALAGDPNALLSPGELHRLAAQPGIEIGGHSVDHPILARAPVDQQAREIRENRRHLEELLGRSPQAFAYPNGRPGLDFRGETEEAVRRAGFADAFTTAGGFTRSNGSRLQHRRFFMLAGISAAELAHRLAFSWQRTP